MNVTCFRPIPTLLVVAAICLISLQSNADDWTTYQHDNAHTGRSSANFDPTLLKKAWGSTGLRFQHPIVAGDAIYDVRGNGHIVNPTTVTSYNFSGTKKWTFDYDINVTVTDPTYAEGQLFFIGRVSSSTYKLVVLDAATGTQKYTVALPPNFVGHLPPVIARNSANQLVAYVTEGSDIAALNLGQNSGSNMWTNSGSIGTSGFPTLVGNSVIMAGPNQYWAFDQLTGAANHFFTGSSSGGGGSTVAFDSSRSQFYVRDQSNGFLTAYSYHGNSDIAQLWRIPGFFSGGGSVAIGADGQIYAARLSEILSLDPSDGHLLRSITGLNLANSNTPVLSSNSLFVFGNDTTEIFDITTFARVASLASGRDDLNTSYCGPGAVFDNGFISYFAFNTTSRGFNVYLAIPEPSSFLIALLTFALLVVRRGRPS
jgi:hypothetical protein